MNKPNTMTREEFAANLQAATRSTFDLTHRLCTNQLAENVEYLLLPDNLNEYSTHLNELEMVRFRARKAEIGRRFSADEVVERLWVDGQVPAWINMTVCRAGLRTSTVELLFDRLLWPVAMNTTADGNGYYHAREGYPPFHALVHIPPYAFNRQPGNKSQGKFNVNWQLWPWRLKLLMWRRWPRFISSFAKTSR